MSTHAPAEESPGPPPDVATTGERIDALIDAIAAAPPPGTVGRHADRARERAEELVRVVTDLYGAGLERLLDIVYDSGRLDDELLALLARDELVAGLLLVHGLHPYDIDTRVEQALAGVRPYLGSHGGDVELVEITDAGEVHLRLLGSCDGCPSSSVTLELAVQDAIEAAAPEVVAIEVDPPTGRGSSGTDTFVSALIPVESLRTRLDTRSSRAGEPGAARHRLDDAVALPPGRGTVSAVGDVAVYVCRVGDDLFAFRDGCARCGHTLAGSQPVRRLGGARQDAVLTCPGCAAHFEVRRAGACLDEPDLHLDPLPVLTEGGAVTLLLPASAAGAVAG